MYLSKKTFLLMIATFTVVVLSAQTVTVTPAGTGTITDPFQIETIENLKWLSEVEEFSVDYPKYYTLTADIDASITKNWVNGGLIPIGNEEKPFYGTFDGQSFTIYNLHISNDTDLSLYGMFGKTINSQVSNLNLEDFHITADGSAGGLVARAIQTTITNCRLIGTIYLSHEEIECAGGIAGETVNSSISNSQVELLIANDDELDLWSYLGGIVGMALITDIINCDTYFELDIYGGNWVGGIVGTLISEGKIDNSHAKIDFTKPLALNAGGLVGRIDYDSEAETELVQITNSSATGKISLIAGGMMVGGLVGDIDCRTIIENCYSTVDIEIGLVFYLGGLIGFGGDCKLHNSFYKGTLTVNTDD